MRTVPAYFSPRQDNVETEMTLDLLAHLLQQVAEEFFDFSAAQADDVGVLAFQASLVVMLVPVVVH